MISLFALGVAEPPAPYPASGWRPSGPAFELPQRIPAQVCNTKVEIVFRHFWHLWSSGSICILERGNLGFNFRSQR